MNLLNDKNLKVARNSNQTDEEIIALVQAGKQVFFDVIIERYRDKLFFYIMRFVKNEDEVKDVLQNVFIKSLKNVDSFDCDRKFSSWIYRIAHNEAVNWATRKNKRIVSIDDLGVQDSNFLVSDDFDVSMEKWFHLELKDVMREAISKLPENYAEVIRMRFIDDMSYKEISNVLGKPVNSVGTLVRRAKKRLLGIVIDSEKL
ncbi:MAG: sigma-70 family RNA polymerase sigma factor [Candidatus Moranbacteria bacterium]|nr:sigma-70 family RNA polymerase sigma factor [Candidatus Moranbacteria bacterium]